MPLFPQKWSSVGPVAIGVLLLAAIVSPATAGSVPQHESCNQTFNMEGPRLYLPATNNATIGGHHDWPANTNIADVLQFPNDSSVNNISNDSVKIKDNRWIATIDLSSIEEGRTFLARLEHEGQVVETVEGTVGNASASVSFDNQTVSGSTPVLTIRRVHLDLGGFVAIHHNSSLGPIVGVSDYLPPGTHENVTVRPETQMTGPTKLVAVAHLDSDCDRDFERVIRDEDGAYVERRTTLNPGAVAATVIFSSPTSSQSPSPTSDSPVSPTPSVQRTPTSTGTIITTPGLSFGSAFVALIGLMYFK